MSSLNPWQKKHRNPKVQKRRKSFCIFTEGETEKIYFKDFGLATIEVRCLGGGGVRHLVEEAKSYMRQSKYSGYDNYWLVFDKDDNSYEDIQLAINIAEKSRIHWCFSNPCFEIWYLLHFEYFQPQTNSEDLKTRFLPSRIPGYKETMSGIYDILKNKQGTAVVNSLKLWPREMRNKEAKQFRIGPATNADSLVCELNVCNK